MAYNAKLIQSRPNTVVEFWSPSAETIAKLDQFKSEGKIISYTLNELEGDFKRTDTVVYNTEADYLSIDLFFDLIHPPLYITRPSIHPLAFPRA